MSKIVVTNNLTLDGVMQAPGRTDEDVRGGFDRGGWAPPYNDEVMGQVMAKGMAQTGWCSVRADACSRKAPRRPISGSSTA
jgi:hypothetical protein